MLEYRTPALVLRTIDRGESDRIVHLYTEALGRVSAIAKGARRSHRRFPGTLEILTVVDVHLVDGPRSALARLEGATLIRSFEPLVSHLGRYAVGCELVEILSRFTAERESSPDLYRFAVGALEVVGQEVPDRLLGVLLLVKTLARLGYRPAFASCTLCGCSIGAGNVSAAFAPRHGGALCQSCSSPDAIRVPARVLAGVEAGLRLPLRERNRIGLRAEDVRLTEVLLDRFLQFHLGAELRTCAFLRRILPLDSLDGTAEAGDTAPAPQGRQTRKPEAGAAHASAPLRGSS